MKKRTLRAMVLVVSLLPLAGGMASLAQQLRYSSALTPDSPSVSVQQANNVDWVGQIGGWVYSVSLEGSYAYIGLGPRLVVLDVSNPAQPAVAGQTSVLPGRAEGVVVAGGYAYVAEVGEGLRIIDVSDPASPSEVGSYDTPGYAQSVAVAGDYAYVADSTLGLRIIDVSDPTAPSETGFYDTPGYAADVTAAGNYAYVADVERGLRIVDVSDPTAPSEVGFYDTPGLASGVAVAGPYAYVGDGETGLRIVDVSSPAAPSEIGFYDTPGLASGVAVVGGYAYVTDEDEGVRIIDVSDPTAPSEIGFYDTPGNARSVTVAGDYAYVADNTFGLRIINVSDPTAPSEIGFYDTPGWAFDVAVAGPYAYVGDWYFGLRIIDVSDPTALTEVGFCDTLGNAYGVAVAGNYAYVADVERGLRIVDVSDPTAPSEVGFYDTPGVATGVVAAGGYAYVTDGDAGLRIIDVSDPTAPSEIGFYDTPGNAHSVAVAGGYAIVADWDAGLRIIDVSDPAAPTEAGFYDTPGNARSVAVAGNYAYVADDRSGLRIIDVSDPAAPTHAGFYDTPGNASGVAVVGGYAYVADGEGGFSILRFTDGSATYSVSGHVEDANGDPIEGVRVWAGFPHGAVTNGDGNYTISGLPAGTYDVYPSSRNAFTPPATPVVVPPDRDGISFAALPVDLSIDSVTPVQVLEGHSLVQNKATAVKVIVRKEGAVPLEDVPVQLVHRGQVFHDFYVFESANLDNSKHTLVSDSRSYPLSFSSGEVTKTIYFFGNALTPVGSSYEIAVTVDPQDVIAEVDEDHNTDSSTQPVYDLRWSKSLTAFPELYIRYFLTDWDSAEPSDYTPFYDASNDFLAAVYPVAEERFAAQMTLGFPLNTPIGFGRLSHVELALWLADRSVGLRLAYPTADRFVAVAPPGWFAQHTTKVSWVGAAAAPAPLVVVEVVARTQLNGWASVAHEIGHTYGLHVKCEEYKTCNPTIKEGIGNYAATGLWVDNHLPMQVTADRSVFCFMGSPEDLEFWIDAADYGGLLDTRSRPVGLAASGDTGQNEAVLAVGKIGISDTATLEAWYRLPEAEIDPPLPGPYTFEYQDADGEILYKHAFGLSFALGGDTARLSDDTALTEMPFAFTVPWVSGTARILIKRDDVVLAEKPVSANAPIVSLNAPQSGDSVSGSTTIAWAAQDLDEDDLSYAVLYSSDSGATWNPIAHGIAGNTFDWDVSRLPSGSEYMLKVIATDGLNTGYAVSEAPFAVLGQVHLPLIMREVQ